MMLDNVRTDTVTKCATRFFVNEATGIEGRESIVGKRVGMCVGGRFRWAYVKNEYGRELH